jgi:hypothetical protein
VYTSRQGDLGCLFTWQQCAEVGDAKCLWRRIDLERLVIKRRHREAHAVDCDRAPDVRAFSHLLSAVKSSRVPLHAQSMGGERDGVADKVTLIVATSPASGCAQRALTAAFNDDHR